MCVCRRPLSGDRVILIVQEAEMKEKITFLPHTDAHYTWCYRQLQLETFAI